MPFSLSSYILGVGTVVGALAVGFGGGAFLTSTVMKEHPSPTRVERVARSEPLPAPQSVNVPVASPQETPAAPVAQAPSVDRDQAQAVQAPPAQPAAAPAAPVVQAEPPKPDVQREVKRAKDPAPAQPVEQARQAEPAKQAESKDAEQRKMAERKGERQKRYAERKPREITIARTRPRRLEVVEEPEVVVSEPQSDLFRTPGFFGRSSYRDE